jgi:GH15 family glucan-1,4-alpha-glucosidase
MSSPMRTNLSNNVLPIENYGLIGNMRTCALIGLDGSIDWCCYPHVDSPPILGRVLDANRGGHFQIAPAGAAYTPKQFYWPDTNVLITRFLSEGGVGEVVDFMPVRIDPDAPGRDGEIMRRVTVITGEMRFHLTCQPAFLAPDYQRFEIHEVELGVRCVRFRAPRLSLDLEISPPEVLEAQQADDGAYSAAFTLHPGQTAWFVLREAAGDIQAREPDYAARLAETLDYWRTWLAGCTYRGCWREQVKRSALAMKLMTFEPTGAVIAAPTSSLPEWIGGWRNWDYRFVFLRDAAFTVDAFMQIGLVHEAEAFVSWLTDRVLCKVEGGDPDRLMQPVYTVRGEPRLPGLAGGRAEVESSAYTGHRDSRPVRFGNSAADQAQLDLYGEVLDAIYVYVTHGKRFISYELWTKICTIADWVCEHWAGTDRSCWEIRGNPRPFVYSKVMCWVALDRALRLARLRSFPAENYHYWRTTRDRIYRDVIKRGWNSDRQAFVQCYGSDALDATSLLMPMVGFIAASDPRMKATIAAMKKPLDQDGLLLGDALCRYDWQELDEGFDPQPEGAFTMCAFWLIEAMARTGDPNLIEEARVLFEGMLAYANHLGLYAEQTGVSGEALGNCPQAFSHLGLINAALVLDQAVNGGDPNQDQFCCHG